MFGVHQSPFGPLNPGESQIPCCLPSSSGLSGDESPEASGLLWLFGAIYSVTVNLAFTHFGYVL